VNWGVRGVRRLHAKYSPRGQSRGETNDTRGLKKGMPLPNVGAEYG